MCEPNTHGFKFEPFRQQTFSGMMWDGLQTVFAFELFQEFFCFATNYWLQEIYYYICDWCGDQYIATIFPALWLWYLVFWFRSAVNVSLIWISLKHTYYEIRSYLSVGLSSMTLSFFFRRHFGHLDYPNLKRWVIHIFIYSKLKTEKLRNSIYMCLSIAKTRTISAFSLQFDKFLIVAASSS